MIDGAPAYERERHSIDARRVAAAAWQSLLLQEDRSRVGSARLVADLRRLGASEALVGESQRIAEQEARHVAVCEHVVRALGFEPRRTEVVLAPLPTEDAAFEGAMIEILVGGFAVAETMSVGGFVAMRAHAREPLARWAIEQLLRDEVGHGAFGEEAGGWALRGWSRAERVALWRRCVETMEAVERKVTPSQCGDVPRNISRETLGALPATIVHHGLIRAVSRWVLPRLGRMGILPVAVT